jgi:hypothetical protein
MDATDTKPRQSRSCGCYQAALYNATRTHLSLNKDAPVHRGVEWAGNVVCRPILGGLHHQYGRI